MASGRSDYWYGMLPGKSILGAGQNDWSIDEYSIVEPTDAVSFCSYTVPAGYRLNITSGMISCNNPGINQATIRISAVSRGIMRFDQLVTFPFTPNGTFVLSGGELFEIIIVNLDTVNVVFYVYLLGFLEYISG